MELHNSPFIERPEGSPKTTLSSDQIFGTVRTISYINQDATRCKHYVNCIFHEDVFGVFHLY